MTKARSNAVANAAKGDLTVGSGTNTSAILALGSDGSSIVADSSTSTGLRYQAPVNVNPVLNSAFQVWQRGTSFAVTAANYTFTADRWQFNSSGNNGTVSRQTTSDTTNLPFIQYCARVQRDSGQTSGLILWYYQPFETVNSLQYAGKTVTMSFYARKGANFSAASDVLNFRLYSGTGTDQNFRSAFYTGEATPINSTATLTSTWQRFSATATIAATATEITPAIYYIPTGTAGAADYFEVTGVQIEIGSVATPFKTYAGTIQEELAACMRYFNRAVDGSVNSNMRLSGGNAFSTTGAEINYTFPVPMRTSPTFSVSAAGHFFLINSTGGVGGYPTGMSGGVLSPVNARVDCTGAGGLTAGNATALQVGTPNARLDFSAEL